MPGDREVGTHGSSLKPLLLVLLGLVIDDIYFFLGRLGGKQLPGRPLIKEVAAESQSRAMKAHVFKAFAVSSYGTIQKGSKSLVAL